MPITREDIRWLAVMAAGQGETFLMWARTDACLRERHTRWFVGELEDLWEWVDHNALLSDKGWQVLKEYGECVAPEEQS